MLPETMPTDNSNALESCHQVNSREEAMTLAIRVTHAHSGRAKVLLLDGASESEWGQAAHIWQKVPDRDASALCRTIGESSERIGALIIQAGWEKDFGFKHFAKRARELASAEGALLIWDESGTVNSQDREWYGIQPDIRIFHSKDKPQVLWIEARMELWAHEIALKRKKGEAP